ncbi:thioredoxin-like protein [Sphaerosporella brunnea]|uniref:Thioredoxin-like protein n=1 Tax=Sphaerosporella brunnea TaxID=1250544 RepID=A0A5J5F717_9PEZI|nr:thioredoxin-like protein [Sphaerosporella brunnea]
MVSAAAKQKVQTIIDENPVAVFSKSHCPHCRATKTTLSDLGAKFYVLELDQTDGGAELQDALTEISGQRTVPNIYISQKHIGGNSDLQAKKSELPALLKAAGAA